GTSPSFGNAKAPFVAVHFGFRCCCPPLHRSTALVTSRYRSLVRSKMADAPASIFQSDLPIVAKLDRAREELLDLSARNRMLNVPRFSKAARTIEVVDERSAQIFRML